MNRIIKCLIDRFSGWDEEDYRRREEETIRKAWPGEAIDLYELISHEEPDGSPESKRKLTIFIDRALDLDWLVVPNPSDAVNSELSKVTAVASIPCKHLPKIEQIAFRQILGAAVACCISENNDEAERQLAAAKEFIEKRITERSRLWSLTFSLLLLVGVFLGLALSFLNGFDWGVFGGKYIFVSPMMMGGLGAYVSIVYSSGSDRRDSSSGKLLHLIEVMSKFAVGVIAGALSYFILKSPLSPEFFHEVEIEGNAILVFGFISGFSEKFIPRMVSSYEKTIEQEKQ